MSRFRKKKKKEATAISTASLPDIVFMLLFFFMIATVIRDTSVMVEQKMPQATEIEKLQKKSLVSCIYIGRPNSEYQKVYGTEPRIQLNDQFGDVADIPEFIAKERESKIEAQIPQMTTSLKVDQKTKMGIVTKVKQQLREVNALKINYAAVERRN
ncbi:MAG: biopolymer transporter ExbD [Flavobacteriales bacterium]|nr:biopolymer transporter ExbD [Flavobacteriales bacterium]MCB9449420.1 biopolymer transporter ExbD [Flavobacteriales bacterium]